MKLLILGILAINFISNSVCFTRLWKKQSELEPLPGEYFPANNHYDLRGSQTLGEEGQETVNFEVCNIY